MELHDLETDACETNSPARSTPEVVSAMKAIIREAHTPLPTQKK